jgi:two-component system, response regulator, stage 0 sporulation protein F
MYTKKVMSVGQCNPDHSSIKNFLEKNFHCEITRVDSTDEALVLLKKDQFDLVLVNRKLDIDYTDGSILIKAMKSEQGLKEVPIMLVSNYPEYQEEAVGLGAVLGFGKSEIGSEKAKLNLAKFLEQKV